MMHVVRGCLLSKNEFCLKRRRRLRASDSTSKRLSCVARASHAFRTRKEKSAANAAPLLPRDPNGVRQNRCTMPTPTPTMLR
ncbi:hypothetical protein, partial [Paraburkholderia bengalensis]|uniref:hypothetical protein n=1 Tax=Paraburkholderia bengalensis TaxID=2747562 RepID=UPI003014ED83